MKIGYARVSTAAQKLDRQIIALEQAGCDKVFSEKASGKTASAKARPQLEKAISCLGEGDELILAEWDRATRSLQDGVMLMLKVHEAGASLKALDRQWLDLSTPFGQGVLALLSAIAQDERERIIRRSGEGRKAAKARGVKMGRKPKLTPHQRKEALARLDKGESTRTIANSYNVHYSTIARLRGKA